MAETGILRGRGKRAVDSTILADAVATQDTITQLISAIRRVGRVVPGAAEVIAAVCTGHDYHRPGKPVIDWDEPGAKDTLVSALVNDANALLAVFAEVDRDESAESGGRGVGVAGVGRRPGCRARSRDPTAPTGGGASPAGSPRSGDIVRWTPMRGTPASHPRRAGYGYRAHVAAEPETGIITDEALTKAAGTQELRSRVWRRSSWPPTSRSADEAGEDGRRRGCHPGVVRRFRLRHRGLRAARSDEAGHDAVIKPKPLAAPVEDGFTVDDFTVDEHAGAVGCPAGHTRPISRTRVASFGALCRECPRRALSLEQSEGDFRRYSPPRFTRSRVTYEAYVVSRNVHTTSS